MRRITLNTGGKIRKFFGNLSVGRKLVTAMLGLVCLFTAAITVYYYSVSSTMIRINAERQIVNTLNQAVNNLDSRIAALESILYDTSTSVYLQELLRKAEKMEDTSDYSQWETTEEIRNLLMVEGTKLSAIQGFYIFDAVGRMYSVRNLRYDFKTEEIEWNRIDEGKGKTVWGNPGQGVVLFGENEAPSVIPVGKTIYSLSTHRKLGYMIVYLDTGYLQQVADDIRFAEDDTIFLLDERGNTLPDQIPAQAGQLPFQMEQIVSCRYEGGEKRIAEWPTESQVWKLMAVTRDEAQNSELLDFRRTTMILLAGAGALAVILSILLSQSISKPILKLVEDMQKFSKGDFSVQVSVLYNDEIGVLRRNFNELVNDINHLITDIYNEKTLKQQAQLRMLQMQINPHFLYNTLDTINWLAQSHGAEDVAEVSRSLGYLMHFSLAEQELISLEEEMDAVEHYMLIQSYRYGEQLKIDLSVAEEALYERVPRHMILPLIENAVEHGLKNKIGEKRIEVTGNVCGNVIYMQVSDNGVGMSGSEIERALREAARETERVHGNQERHMSIGLRNVNRRIQLCYGEEYGIQIKSKVGQGTTVTVRIPCQAEMAQGETRS